MSYYLKCKEIPSNCIFNKINTGNGGTMLELDNRRRNSIIAVPYTNLVESKLDQYKNGSERYPGLRIMGVYSNGKERWERIEEIKEYINKRGDEPHKIMVTYDSLPMIIQVIEEERGDEVYDYFLLIDEAHDLTLQYGWRENAVNNVLGNYRKFKEWCFMTATPVGREFMPEQFEDIKIVRADVEQRRPNVRVIETRKLREEICWIVQEYLEFKETNAHIFVNSIKFIKYILEALKELTPENTKVVWSIHNKQYENLSGFKRGKPHESAKKINFYTSTSFEGCDIYDPDGEVIVVADGYREHTLVDIPTSFVQIAGRIRNSEYNKEVSLVWRINKGNKRLNYEDFEKYKNENIEETQHYFNYLNTLANKDGEPLQGLCGDGYYRSEEGELKVAVNKFNYEMMNYKVVNKTFKSTKDLCKAIEYAGMKFELHERDQKPSTKLRLCK